MRAFRLFTALLFILTSYTCEAQFPWLVKAFVKEATETAVTRSTINYFNKTAASKFVTHELENFAFFLQSIVYIQSVKNLQLAVLFRQVNFTRYLHNNNIM